MSNKPFEQAHLSTALAFNQYYFHPTATPEYIITSPNMNYLPPPPPPQDNRKHNLVVYWKHPRFIPDNMPYLAYLHTKPQLSGEIFGRLNHTYNDVPIVLSPGGRFILRDDVQRSWRRLEVALDGIQRLLIIGSQTNHCNSMNYGEMPSDCGYLQPHEKEHIARYCAIKSRNAFFLLAAICSFGISFYRAGHRSSLSIPGWHKVLIAKGCDVQWIELLEQTFVCDFAPGARVGGYIHANTTKIFPQIRALLDSNVPVWIEWYLPSISVSDSQYGKSFLPRDGEIKRAIDLAATNNHEPIYAPTDRWIAVDHRNDYWRGAEPFDDAVDDDGFHQETQLVLPGYDDPDDESDYGEEISSSQRAAQLSSPPAPTAAHAPVSSDTPVASSAFDAGMAYSGTGQLPGEKHEDFFFRMSRERLQRMNRETKSERQERLDMEGKARTGLRLRSSAVFIWELHGGRWYRQFVDERKADIEFGRFPHHMRRYHFHTNEWDLCTFKEPTLNEQLSFGEDLNALYDVTLAAQSTRRPTEGLKELLASRFGFTLDGEHQPFAPPGDREIKGLLKDKEGHRARIRIHGGENDKSHDSAVRDLWNIVLTTTRVSELPHRLDMSPEAALRPSFVHEKFALAVMSVSPREAGEKICLIGVKGEPFLEQHWLLAIRDFSTVVQIFREETWKTGILQVARQLIDHGIPFNTVRFQRQLPTADHERCQGLGFRPRGYKSKLVEYAGYEKQRSKLLGDYKGVYAWVALKAGGLYWRMAIEHAGDSKKLVREMLKSGPSKWAGRRGQVVGELSFGCLVDDQFSPAALAVLSGVYQVETHIARQTEDASWWPRKDVWDQSELNVGYWSERCEEWYQRRLSDIREGTGGLMNSTEWKAKLKRAPHTALFKSNFNVLSQEFMTANASVANI